MSLNQNDHFEALLSFVDAFVISDRKARWRELLSKGGESAFKNRAKLMNAFDPRFCKQVDDIESLDPSIEGVFYDFYSEPRAAKLSDAIDDVGDSIFVIKPGRLALYFSHETWVWLFERDHA